MSDTDSTTIPESGALTLSDAAWEEARRRVKIIGPLSECDTVPSTIASAAGDQLGLSSRTVYSLLRRYRESSGSVVSLAPRRSDGGRGGSRLPEKTEHLIYSVINDNVFIAAEIQNRGCDEGNSPSLQDEKDKDTIGKYSPNENSAFAY